MKHEDRLVHHHYSGEPCKACRLAGIKEVVDWVKANASLERGDRDVGLCFEDYLHFEYENWQAKLKEWGIKEK